MAANRKALEVYLDCNDQWRAGFNGAYAIDGRVVLALIDAHGLGDRLTVYRKVRYLANAYLDQVRENGGS